MVVMRRAYQQSYTALEPFNTRMDDRFFFGGGAYQLVIVIKSYQGPVFVGQEMSTNK